MRRRRLHRLAGVHRRRSPHRLAGTPRVHQHLRLRPLAGRPRAGLFHPGRAHGDRGRPPPAAVSQPVRHVRDRARGLLGPPRAGRGAEEPRPARVVPQRRGGGGRELPHRSLRESHSGDAERRRRLCDPGGRRRDHGLVRRALRSGAVQRHVRGRAHALDGGLLRLLHRRRHPRDVGAGFRGARDRLLRRGKAKAARTRGRHPGHSRYAHGTHPTERR
mmetsp:Transcript_24295/g.48328  ORF Transcript_24295/g.48328 Transcript_24295/m.48328 type:complete len:218 (-) Transcript_24295:2312-2965(-)